MEGCIFHTNIKIPERRSHQVGAVNVVTIVAGVLLIAIAIGSIIASFRCLYYLDYDIAFMSITAFMCGVAAILAGIYLK